jgi:hypothetical protein
MSRGAVHSLAILVFSLVTGGARLSHACEEPDRELVPYAYSASPPLVVLKHRIDYEPPQVKLQTVDLVTSSIKSELLVAGDREDEAAYATRTAAEAVAFSSGRLSERLL